MLKLKVIACDVLNREISHISSQSGCFVDVTYLHQGLHNTPSELRTKLQAEIDRVNSEEFPYNFFGMYPRYDYIIAGYGLCSNGIVGVSSEKIPLVIPRGHDCITLLLGSKERYKGYFDKNPGTYWFTGGWIERCWQPNEDNYKATYEYYVEKYGEDNAEYLMDMEQAWLKNYKNAAFIGWDCLGNLDYHKDFTGKTAKFLSWTCDELSGDSSLLTKLLNGIFDEDETLIVPPGKKVAPSYDGSIIKCE